MTTNFPSNLDDLNAGIGTANDKLISPSHITQHTNESDAIEAIQTKLGVDNSAVTTTIDYLLKNTSSVSPGHKHVSSEITDFTTAVDNIFNSRVSTSSLSLSSAQILALHTTPVELIPAPGVGKIIVVDSVVWSFTAGTQYILGTDVEIRYDGGSFELVLALNAGVMRSASSSITATSALTATNLTITTGTNKSVVVTLDDAIAFTTGTGTLKAFAKYRVITL